MSRVKQAVILAGGKGERLRPLTDELPKPMVEVNGIPFLDYLIQSLVDVGITKILILVGYKHEKIVARYGDSVCEGRVKIEYSIGSVNDQTGRRLLNASDLLEDRFLLVYGDNYWPIPLKEMVDHFESKDGRIMTTVFSNEQGTAEYGFENNTEVDDDFYVKCYDKQRQSKASNGVDMGYFLISKDEIDLTLEGNISFEEVILTQKVKEHRLMAYVTDEQYYYITNVETLKDFENYAINNNIQSVNWEAQNGVF